MKEPVVADISIIADKNINPAVDGRASPVVIRIYQLSEKAKFDNSDFFALYENDQSLLASDIQSRTELEIRPEKNYQQQHAVKPDTRFIAVLAAFRDLDNAQWKDIISIPSDKSSLLNIAINKNSITLKAQAVPTAEK